MTPKKLMIIVGVKVALLVIAVGVVFSMYGCNTVRGVGQDVQKAGEAIERAVK